MLFFEAGVSQGSEEEKKHPAISKLVMPTLRGFLIAAQLLFRKIFRHASCSSSAQVCRSFLPVTTTSEFSWSASFETAVCTYYPVLCTVFAVVFLFSVFQDYFPFTSQYSAQHGFLENVN